MQAKINPRYEMDVLLLRVQDVGRQIDALPEGAALAEVWAHLPLTERRQMGDRMKTLAVRFGQLRERFLRLSSTLQEGVDGTTRHTEY